MKNNYELKESLIVQMENDELKKHMTGDRKDLDNKLKECHEKLVQADRLYNNLKATMTGKHIEYQHKGISNRSFKRSFALGEYMEVTSAKFENGMLSIIVERIVPEDKKPKTIKIKRSEEHTSELQSH